MNNFLAVFEDPDTGEEDHKMIPAENRKQAEKIAEILVKEWGSEGLRVSFKKDLHTQKIRGSQMGGKLNGNH